MESEKHKLLKEYAKIMLKKKFGAELENIYEEFAIGKIKFDVCAFPSVENINSLRIGVECGNKKGNIESNAMHFKESLKFVDFIIWIPYRIFRAPYSDLIRSELDDVYFYPLALPLFENKFANVANSTEKTIICSLLISIRGRYPSFERKYCKPSGTSWWKLYKKSNP